jgi:serine/threonine protein kinase
MFAHHPTAIGPYRVLEVLGHGGVGTVYLVQQREPFRRTAALKLVKLGMDTREVLVRFSQERQVLASMNHPNIAKLFDAGQTETGRPYFVMEYVAGEPITDHCDRNRLGLRERLELFATVCRALHHAHQRGVLHRDVKPSNILVSNQEGRHVPVMIDFGLAKVLRSEPASALLLTRTGQFIGTPRYMSPEQIELVSDEIDARADVYALGVVLFELIVGEAPNERALTDGGLARLLRSVRAEGSPRPSSRLTRMRDAADEIAAKRGTERWVLEGQVRGDLDWIVVKALERERERRYASAAELAADVERYLRREPIAARPPSASYRVERFVRRNPLAVGALLAVVLALLLGSASSTFWHLRAEQMREPKAALMALCEKTRLSVADAHVWLEEAIGDDESANIERDVLAPLRRAHEEVAAALAGAPASLARASRSGTTAARLARLSDELGQLITITEKRWEKKDSDGGIGGTLDQRYDVVYKSIQAVCAEIVHALQQSSARDWKLATRSALVVDGAVVLVLLVSSAVVMRFWLKRP